MKKLMNLLLIGIMENLIIPSFLENQIFLVYIRIKLIMLKKESDLLKTKLNNSEIIIILYKKIKEKQKNIYFITFY